MSVKNITAISYGRPAAWGRCFTIVRKEGLCAVGERARVTLADEFGLTWRGLAECFGATRRPDGRTAYDFEKIGEADWMKKGGWTTTQLIN